MHQPPDISIRTKRPRRWLLLGTTVAVVLCAQIAARSGLVVRPLVEARLPEIEFALNGRVDIGAIRPAGLWSVELRDVTFRPLRTPEPHADDAPLATIERVRVTPDLGGLLAGDPRPRAVAVRGLRVTAIVDAGDGPHAEWARWLTYTLERRSSTVAAPGGHATNVVLPSPPVIEVQDATFSFDDRSGAIPSLGARCTRARFVPPHHGRPGEMDGDVLIEGLGHGDLDGATGGDGPFLAVRLRDSHNILPFLPFDVPLNPDAEVAFGGVQLDWPPTVTFRDLDAHGLGLDAPSGQVIDRLRADHLTVSASRNGVGIDAQQVGVTTSAARTPWVIDRVRSERAWDADSLSAALEFSDERGGQGRVDLTLAEDGGATAALNAEALDLARIARPAGLGAVVRAPFTGEATVVWHSADRVATASIRGGVSGASLHAPALASRPVEPLSADLQMRVSVWPETHALLVENGRLRLTDANVNATFSGSRSGEATTFALRASAPAQPAQTLVDTIPEALRPALAGLVLEGDIGLDIEIALDTTDLEALTASVTLNDDTATVVQFPDRAPIDQLAAGVFALELGSGDHARAFGPATPNWVTLGDLSPLTYRAIVAAEDDAFWDHSGFDGRAIRRALQLNIEAGTVVRGGSTISQQVAKNLFLTHERTVARKVQEAVLTLLLERTLSKEQILELYVNLVEWGDGVFGIRGGALAYFNRDPAQLTLRESAFLAAILPNPVLFGQQYLDGALEESRLVKMANILHNLHRAGYLSEATYLYHRGLVEQGLVSVSAPAGTEGADAPVGALVIPATAPPN